jgi:hypothetical protein
MAKKKSTTGTGEDQGTVGEARHDLSGFFDWLGGGAAADVQVAGRAASNLYHALNPPNSLEHELAGDLTGSGSAAASTKPGSTKKPTTTETTPDPFTQLINQVIGQDESVASGISNAFSAAAAADPMISALQNYHTVYNAGQGYINQALGSLGQATDQEIQTAPYALPLQALQSVYSNPYYLPLALSQNKAYSKSLPPGLAAALNAAGIGVTSAGNQGITPTGSQNTPNTTGGGASSGTP